MSYYICVRFSIFIIILTICIFIINTRMQPEKRLKVIIASALMCSVICFTVLWFVPFENTFLSFATVQEAYSYYSKEDADIMITGKDTCLIVSSDKKDSRLLIFPKENDGWKIKNGSHLSLLNAGSSDNIFVTVFYYRNSDDRYLRISNMVGSELDISDKFDTKFHKDDKNYYYAYVENLTDNYVLTVNGKELKLKTR